MAEVNCENITSEWSREFVLSCIKTEDSELCEFLKTHGDDSAPGGYSEPIKLVKFQLKRTNQKIRSECGNVYLSSEPQTLHLELLFAKTGQSLVLCSHMGCFGIAVRPGVAGPACEKPGHQKLACERYRLLLKFSKWVYATGEEFTEQNWRKYLESLRTDPENTAKHPVWLFGQNPKFGMHFDGDSLSEFEIDTMSGFVLL